MTAKIQEVKIKKTMTGRVKLHYTCPACKAKLNSSRHDIGKTDNCPECGTEFLLCPEVEEYLERIDAAVREGKERAKRLKEQELQDGSSEEYRKKIQGQIDDFKKNGPKGNELKSDKKSGVEWPQDKGDIRQVTHSDDYVNFIFKGLARVFFFFGALAFFGLFAVVSDEAAMSMIAGVFGLWLSGVLFVIAATLRDIRFILGTKAVREETGRRMKKAG